MTTTKPRSHALDRFHPDRPGWIPETVGENWDRHPYAHQTREERMPAGHLHGLYLQTLLAMLKPVLDRLGLRLYIDVFVFYRDWEGRKQRIAPDAVIAPALPVVTDESLQKYDLDDEPIPLCVIEVISHSSREDDTNRKRMFYAALGINEYLLLDVEDDNEQPLDQVEITLWRMEHGIQRIILPDSEGFVTLSCLGVRLRADGRTLLVQDITTGAWLLDTPELQAAYAQAAQRAAEEMSTRRQAEQRAAEEHTACLHAEAELETLRAELARLRAGQE